MKHQDNNTLLITNGGGRNAGLFSYVGQVIGNLHVSDNLGLKMWVNIPHSPYLEPGRGLNCWDYYFQQPYGICEEDLLKYNNIIEKEWFDDKLDTITPNFTPEIIQRAREITLKYKRPADTISRKIEDFKKNILKTDSYGAVHFRGTDHHYGTPTGTFPIITQDYYFQYVDQLLTKYEKVLVCSDQQDFIENALIKFGKDRIVSYPSIRSTNHIAIHYNNNDNKYRTGEDVTIEAFLMSESKYLVRTCSGVTHFSIFNAHDPDFKFINIDEIYYGKKH